MFHRVSVRRSVPRSLLARVWRALALVAVVVLALTACAAPDATGARSGTPGTVGTSPSSSSADPCAPFGSPDYSQVPTNPVSVPGPAANFVPSAVTTQHVESNFSSIVATTHFTAPATVYVAAQVKGVQSGSSHTLGIRWSLNGHEIPLPTTSTSLQLTGNTNVSLSLSYVCRGGGMTQISLDGTLAQTVQFGVY